ncbi:hypothetical protein [Candidatus Magnetaquicoccus inordinatus]|uniref:hypothetical protein n=1 Tax=Candidatus Magnetaquicoccus inordinatus TaxID=2496818 RepID=UPI00102B6017|nr:hypothetical protein [Candidatus Magnetaquicoccus inordinatus]
MNKKFAIFGEIVIGFISKRERKIWLLAHPAARAIRHDQFPAGIKKRDAVPSFLFDAINQEFPPDQAEFCIQSIWNDVGKKRKSK